jgi:tRNA nucleotidyltransferase (CCA-adding enzyme)
MAIEISKDKAGDLVDYFNGKKDLADRKLRVLHDASFIDDPTRILRGIRFEQRHNFVFEPNTMHLLKDAVRLSLIEKVEPQRLRDELICMFKEDKPLNIVNRMDELTGLKFISPSVKMPDSVRRLFLSLEHWAGWFRQHNPGERALDLWLLYFMGLLMPLSGHEVSGICRRFVLRKGEEKRIVSGIETCSRLIQALGQKTVRPSAIYHMLAPLSYEVIILLLAQSESTVATERIKGFLKESSGAKISVSGHDLGAWGLEPGPAYQKIFKAVLNAKLDGKLKSKEEELHLARMIAAAYKRSKARQQHP